MATIAKIQRAKGVTYRAIVKRDGRILKTKCFKTRTAARQWAKRIESDAETMEALGERGARLTFAAVATEYLDQWSGRARSRCYQIAWWRDQLGTRPISSITADDVRRSLQVYQSGPALHCAGADSAGRPVLRESARSRSPASVNRMKAALSALYRFASQSGYTTRNPARLVPAKREENLRTRYLSEDERQRLLASCRNSTWPKLYLLVLSAIMTGARKGELKALRWEQIDFPQRQVELSQTKNGQPRVLPLPMPVIEELARVRERFGLVFASTARPGRPFDEKKAWQRALSEAAITNFRFHDLRHSAASYLAMGGATLLEIADVLGHKSLQTTKRYAHLSVDHKREITDRILGGLSR